jgi:signal peptidase I
MVVLFTAFWLISSLVISATVLRTFSVDGASMSPTLHPGERISILLIGGVGRQDVVILSAPPHAPDHEGFVKRVVAIGGDFVSCCTEGHLVVNGAVVREPYAATSQPRIARIRIPPGDLFVLGDNRLDSADSRSWGPIPSTRVVGRVVAQGPTAYLLSPLVIGFVIGVVLAVGAWMTVIRRTALWRSSARPKSAETSAAIENSIH